MYNPDEPNQYEVVKGRPFQMNPQHRPVRYPSEQEMWDRTVSRLNTKYPPPHHQQGGTTTAFSRGAQVQVQQPTVRTFGGLTMPQLTGRAGTGPQDFVLEMRQGDSISSKVYRLMSRQMGSGSGKTLGSGAIDQDGNQLLPSGGVQQQLAAPLQLAPSHLAGGGMAIVDSNQQAQGTRRPIGKKNSSTVLRLGNVASPSQVQDQEFMKSILVGVQSFAGPKAQIASSRFHISSKNSAVAFIFVKLTQIVHSAEAAMQLAQKSFDGKVVEVAFYPAADYDAGRYEELVSVD